ncbi:MAG: helix-turn-helix domain-containing protein [Ruminococcus bicirculans (ex Wegman et al. 2014)]
MSNDSKDELTLRIGEKLTAARIESGYTQSCAARAVGTSQSCISAVEHGKKQNVNIIIALIKLYGAPMKMCSV